MIGLISCDMPKSKPNTRERGKLDETEFYRIIDIDSCEYYVYRNGGNASLTHKGNCKYCTQRKEIKP